MRLHKHYGTTGKESVYGVSLDDRGLTPDQATSRLNHITLCNLIIKLERMARIAWCHRDRERYASIITERDTQTMRLPEAYRRCVQADQKARA